MLTFLIILAIVVVAGVVVWRRRVPLPVSYTHLTLPTNREV